MASPLAVPPQEGDAKGVEESKSRENPQRILIMAKSAFSELLQTLGLLDISTLRPFATPSQGVAIRDRR